MHLRRKITDARISELADAAHAEFMRRNAPMMPLPSLVEFERQVHRLSATAVARLNGDSDEIDPDEHEAEAERIKQRTLVFADALLREVCVVLSAESGVPMPDLAAHVTTRFWMSPGGVVVLGGVSEVCGRTWQELAKSLVVQVMRSHVQLFDDTLRGFLGRVAATEVQ
jgi:hypothetical protein